jgi:hypothetical protein
LLCGGWGKIPTPFVTFPQNLYLTSLLKHGQAMENAKRKMDFFEQEKKVYANRNRFPHIKPYPLILVILPQSAPDIRKHVTHWGDFVSGIPTQCVRSDKLARANDQYCNNVALKLVLGALSEFRHSLKHEQDQRKTLRNQLLRGRRSS